MEVYLVRHTTPEVEKGVCYGQTDLYLKDSFESECQLALQRIPPHPDMIIYSSPLTRCRQLAEKFISEKVIYDTRLMELNFGTWEMKKWDDIDKRELDPWMEDFVNVQPPGGESMLMMNERVSAFWEELKSKNHVITAIITHGGVIKIILALYNGLPLINAFDFQVEYGEVVRLEI